MAYTNIIDNIDFVDDNEKQYIYDYIGRLSNEGEDIEEHLNELLERRTKLKKRGLFFIKSLI